MKLMKLLEHPARFVNSLQVVISTINIVVGMIVLRIWRQTIELHLNAASGAYGSVPGFVSGLIAVIIMLYILLTFGILLPKKIAAAAPEKWAYAGINIAYISVFLTAPLAGLVSLSVKGILRLLGLRDIYEQSDVTEETIIDMAGYY